MQRPDFWLDHEKAQEISRRYESLKKEIARGLTYISQVLNAAERVQ